jgi:quercetin dioxygenase-like cupin family protein
MRIDSATSWPTVRSAGGSAAGRGSPALGYESLAMRAEGIVGGVSFDVVQAGDLQWEEREPLHGQAPRSQASITDAAKLAQSRARMWRYPAHTRGRRHIDRDQEEVFVPLRGTLTLLLEDPPQRVDVEPGGLVAVHPGTAMQARNESDDEILFFAYGAPPVHGNAQFVDDVDEL